MSHLVLDATRIAGREEVGGQAAGRIGRELLRVDHLLPPFKYAAAMPTFANRDSPLKRASALLPVFFTQKTFLIMSKFKFIHIIPFLSPHAQTKSKLFDLTIEIDPDTISIIIQQGRPQ